MQSKFGSILAAGLVGFMTLSPVAGLAQERDLACSEDSVQTYCKVKREMTQLNMPPEQIQKLDNASDEQLRRIDVLLTGEGTKMTVQNEVESVLDTIE